MKNDFIAFAAAIMNVEPSMLSLETRRGSLPAFDSVVLLRLILETESKYNVKFSLEESARIETLGDFYKKVVEDRLKDKVLECFPAAAEISSDTKIRELDGWSSLAAFSILISIEREFGKTLSVQELLRCDTLSDLSSAVAS